MDMSQRFITPKRHILMDNYNFFKTSYGSGFDSDEPTYSVNLVINSSGTSKLHLIKVIKSLTLMGLKDSKDFVDSLPKKLTILLTKSQIKELKADLIRASLIDGEDFILTDANIIRNRQLSLGLADKQEVIQELIEKDINYLITSEIGKINIYEIISKVKNLLKSTYSHIDKETLEKIYITDTSLRAEDDDTFFIVPTALGVEMPAQ